MKNFFKSTLFFTCLMCVANSAYAYKFVIYTDEPGGEHSNKVADIMKTTYPFNKFNIEVEIVVVPTSDLGCDDSAKSNMARQISCNKSFSIQQAASKRGGDQALIISNSTTWAGKGSSVPVITTGTSPRAMLHEYLHTLGAADEYEYSETEASVFCDGTKRINLAYFAPLDSYSSDEFARKKHHGKIPWYGDILSSTPITNSNGTAIGTGNVETAKLAAVNTSEMPQSLDEPIGLYRGKVCNKKVWNNMPSNKVSFYPGDRSTIMTNVEAGLGGSLEKIVENSLIKKGVERKIQINETTVSPNNESKDVPVVGNDKTQVDDTQRSSNKKSFFDMIKGLFNKIGNAVSR